MRPGRGSVPSADIMLVDDDPIAIKMHGQLLASQGHHIVSVESAKEALAAVVANPPDLIVSDVMMMHVDGIELARSLRALPAMRDVPIMLISVLDDRETRVRAEEIADHFMAKPLDGLEFVLRVSQLLKQRARILELRSECDRLRAELGHLQAENLRLSRLLDSAVTGRQTFEGSESLYTETTRVARRR